MSMIVVELSTDTRSDVVLDCLSEIVRKHPGNDRLEVILHTRDGLRVFSPLQGVDSWDPRLRVQLDELRAHL